MQTVTAITLESTLMAKMVLLPLQELVVLDSRGIVSDQADLNQWQMISSSLGWVRCKNLSKWRWRLLLHLLLRYQIMGCLAIGLHRQSNGHWYYFDGKIDDIGIWDRALTQSEVVQLHTGVIDTVSPTVTLVGSSTVTVTAIEARTAIESATILPTYWTDPYITVQDDVDGLWDPISTETTLIVTSTIMFSGLDTPEFTIPVTAVDYTIPGIYTISYDATDSAGNNATQVTRVVTILADLTAPVITLVGSSTVTVTAIEARTAIDSAATLPTYWTDPYITVQDDVDGLWDPI